MKTNARPIMHALLRDIGIHVASGISPPMAVIAAYCDMEDRNPWMKKDGFMFSDAVHNSLVEAARAFQAGVRTSA